MKCKHCETDLPLIVLGRFHETNTIEHSAWRCRDTLCVRVAELEEKLSSFSHMYLEIMTTRNEQLASANALAERYKVALEAVTWRGNIDEDPDDFNEAHAWWKRCDEIARAALAVELQEKS